MTIARHTRNTDHLASTRFFVLLVVVAIAAIVPLLFVSDEITRQAPSLSGTRALFLALFVVGSPSIGSSPHVDHGAGAGVI